MCDEERKISKNNSEYIEDLKQDLSHNIRKMGGENCIKKLEIIYKILSMEKEELDKIVEMIIIEE